MKKIGTILLMILTVCMSMSLQSCNNDEEDLYTFTAKITDRGDLSDKDLDAINQSLTTGTSPNYTSLGKAKDALNKAVDVYKDSFEREMKGNTYKFTISYIIANSKGETAYKVDVKVDGEKVTVVR